MARILLFESKSRGHVSQHSVHLLREARRRLDEGRRIELDVMLPRAVLERLPRAVLDPWSVRELAENECRACGEGPAVSRAMRRWRLIATEVQRRRSTHVHWLDLDIVQLQLFARRSPGPRVTQSGLLFRPSVHYREAFGDRPTVRERVRDARKRIVYRGMLANPTLRTVFTFDPWFALFAKSRFRTGAKVVGIDEPAERADQCERTDDAPTDRTRFLLPGSLEERKGVLHALRALLELPDDEASRVELRLVGQVHEQIKAAVLRLVDEIESGSRATVSLRDAWVSERRLAQEYDSAHVILLPYQRFVGSSGILTRAMRAAKPVIAQDYGLLGHLCRSRRLGPTVDTRDPQALAGAVSAMSRRHDGRPASSPPGTAKSGGFAAQVWERILGGAR